MSREGALANEKVRPKAFVHVVFKAKRFEEMVEFYKKLLNGWEVAGAEGHYSFQTYDEEHHRIAIANFSDATERDPKAAGLEHIAYTYATLGDLLANYLRLKKLEILPYWCINHGPTTSLYYSDPDGNQIETQVDNYDTVEEGLAFFETDTFKANPLGVQFDPDKMVDLYRDGVPDEKLKRQGVAPRAPGTEYDPGL